MERALLPKDKIGIGDVRAAGDIGRHSSGGKLPALIRVTQKSYCVKGSVRILQAGIADSETVVFAHIPNKTLGLRDQSRAAGLG
jgi:hypothetical protein